MVNQKAKEELRQLLHRRSEALVCGDLSFFEETLADHFIYTNASGNVYDKNGYIDFYIKSKQIQWKSQILDEITIQWYNDVAVVTCQIFDQATYQGEPFESYFRSTQVFVLISGKWQYSAGQTTGME